MIKILNDRALETIENPRLLSIKEKTLPYDYTIIHVPGKNNNAPDAMSRYPTKSCAVGGVDDVDIDEGFSMAFATMQSGTMPGSLSWSDIDRASAHDEECLELRDTIERGFPEVRTQLPEKIRRYFQMKQELYLIENTIFKGRKMLIPQKLRQQVLEGLHAAHQGVTSMRANARERFFWPGLDVDLKMKRDSCHRCNENAPTQQEETMIYTMIPELPFQSVAVDYYHSGGHEYLIYTDRFTGWTEVARVQNTSFLIIKKNLLSWFRTFGVPEEISSDGGPPFNSSEYKAFLQTWGVTSRKSSAYYPQSNGRAEVAVKTMKRCLQGCADQRHGGLDNEGVAMAIMTHRNTPSQETGISPAEMLYGVKLRDHLPNKFRSIRKEWHDVSKARELQNSIKMDKMTSSKKRSLSPLKVGDSVSVQNQSWN